MPFACLPLTDCFKVIVYRRHSSDVAGRSVIEVAYICTFLFFGHRLYRFCSWICTELFAFVIGEVSSCPESFILICIGFECGCHTPSILYATIYVFMNTHSSWWLLIHRKIFRWKIVTLKLYESLVKTGKFDITS